MTMTLHEARVFFADRAPDILSASNVQAGHSWKEFASDTRICVLQKPTRPSELVRALANLSNT